MLKIKKVKKEIEVDVVEDVYCNMCGDVCPGFRTQNGHEVECVSIHKVWGYNSSKDMVEQRMELCEKCWDWICDRCLIPVAEHDPGYECEDGHAELEENDRTA